MQRALTVLGLLFILISQLLAATNWYVDIGRSGASLNTGTNWDNAFTNLQDALTIASTNDQVWVARGTYIPTNPAGRSACFSFNSNQVSLLGGFTNGGSMADRNWTSNPTVLSGDIGITGVNTDNCYRVMVSKYYMTIDGFTIRDGYNYDSGYGAGLYGYGSGYAPSNILNCTFINNFGQYGGAVCIYGEHMPSSYVLLVSNCTFVGNVAKESGGALYIRWTYHVIVRNCFFYNNRNVNNLGSAIYFAENLSAPDPVMEDCVFIGNYTSLGATMRINTPMSIRRCLFAGNYGSGKGGVAVVMGQSGNLGAPIKFENCTMAMNYGSYGGALYHGNDSSETPGLVTLTNSILYDNNSWTHAYGDEIYNRSVNTTLVSYTCITGFGSPAVVTLAGGLVSNVIGNVTSNPWFATNLYSGKWTANGVYDTNTAQTTLFCTNATWTINNLAGFTVNPHFGDRAGAANVPQFPIVGNTVTSLTVWGDAVNYGSATSGANYVVNDFRLKSRYGRMLPDGTRVQDDRDSPCLDAGNPASSYTCEPRPNGRRINLGYDGNTESASQTWIPSGTIFTLP